MKHKEGEAGKPRITVTLDRNVHARLIRLAARCGFRSSSAVAATMLRWVLEGAPECGAGDAVRADDEVGEMFASLSSDHVPGRWEANRRT